jgi:LAS superfamily LD-carboxypeptidase LdcB
MAVQNGQIPSSQLKRVQGLVVRLYLLTSSADAWLAMRAACKKATGVTLWITSPYGAYRSLKAQFAMWADRYNRDKYPAGVAYPGVSVHGLGRSVDINNWGAAAVWLRDHADEYGFHRTLPNEAWHFEHSGGSSGTAGSITGTIATDDRRRRTWALG